MFVFLIELAMHVTQPDVYGVRSEPGRVRPVCAERARRKPHEVGSCMDVNG